MTCFLGGECMNPDGFCDKCIKYKALIGENTK